MRKHKNKYTACEITFCKNKAVRLLAIDIYVCNKHYMPICDEDGVTISLIKPIKKGGEIL